MRESNESSCVVLTRIFVFMSITLHSYRHAVLFELVALRAPRQAA